jgi:phosphatidylinositol glycan class Q protein
MVASNGLFRIFWPSDAPVISNPGVIIGWRNSEHDVLVVAILHDVEVRCETRLADRYTN